MKKLVCEICGGSDLQKNSGVFVCGGCGAKYSVEEAKALLVEVSEGGGSAFAKTPTEPETPISPFAEEKKPEKADNSDIFGKFTDDNLIKKPADSIVITPVTPPAPDTFEREVNQETIAEGYEKAAEKVKASLKVADMPGRRAAFNALCTFIASVFERYNVEDEASLRCTMEKIHTDAVEIYVGDCALSQSPEEKKKEADETAALCVSLVETAAKMFEDVFAKFPAEKHASIIYLKKSALDLHDVLGSSGSTTARFRITHLERCRTLVAEIKAIEPSFASKEDYASLIAKEEKFDKRFESGKSDAQNKNSGCCGGCCIPVALLMLLAIILFI